MTPYPLKHFGSSGDLGDVIISLPIVQQLGGSHGYWFYNRPFTKDIESRFHLIAPLLMAQPYIEVVGTSNGRDVDYDLSEFRSHYRPDRTLLASHADYAHQRYGLPVPTGAESWLTVEPAEGISDRIVIARSARYHNPHFPWKKIVQHYGERILFIGIPEEHADFCRQFGKVEHQKTADLLEAAQLITGSALFIGNQSSPNAVAEGLKHRRIQETNLGVPDCIFPGSTNAQYVADGGVVLPAVGDTPELVITSPFRGFRPFDPRVTPPEGWKYPGCITQLSLNALASEVRKKEAISVDEASQRVYTYNCERCPDFFRSTEFDRSLHIVNKSRTNAGLI